MTVKLLADRAHEIGVIGPTTTGQTNAVRGRRSSLRIRPRKLITGKFCAIAAGVRFLLPGTNHADLGPSTYPFGAFGCSWTNTMDLVRSTPSRGDTVVCNDVWFGYQAVITPGVTIGHGAVIVAGSVVTADAPPYAIVGGNPAHIIRHRFDEAGIKQLPAELLKLAEAGGWAAERRSAAGD